MPIKNGIQWFEKFAFAADTSSNSVIEPVFLTVNGVIAICAVLIFLGWLIDWLHPIFRIKIELINDVQ